MSLPSCRVSHPTCGACGCETSFDDGQFFCDGCGLNYGDGEDYTEATFWDEEAEPCGHPCDNHWHGADKIRLGLRYSCSPCVLPSGHTSLHWTDCAPVAES